MRFSQFVLGGLISVPFVAFPLGAQTAAALRGKTALVSRLQHTPPRIDGVLEDSAWAAAAPITDFLQKAPVEGGQPSERTEIRVIHDDEALYVGARMYRTNPRA